LAGGEEEIHIAGLGRRADQIRRFEKGDDFFMFIISGNVQRRLSILRAFAKQSNKTFVKEND